MIATGVFTIGMMSFFLSFHTPMASGFRLDHVRGEDKELLSRAVMFPGTNWCGAGNSAEELGPNTATDACCKQHDHCPHHIAATSSKYGLFNKGLFVMSHCECDKKFYSCLKEAGTNVAINIGKIFFNVLSPNCFEFHEVNECVEWSFWGRCEKYATVEKAVEKYADVF